MTLRPAVPLALIACLTLLLGACGGGGDDDADGGTDATTTTSSEAVTTTTEAELDVSGTWNLALSLVESVPPDVLPVEERERARELTLALGPCPAETTFEGAEAAAVFSVTPVTDPGTCVGSARWEQNEDNFLVDVPLLLDGDAYTVAATIVGTCIDAETGEVQSPDGGTSVRSLTFTVAEGATAPLLEGQLTTENSLDPVDCDPPSENFASSLTFTATGAPA